MYAPSHQTSAGTPTSTLTILITIIVIPFVVAIIGGIAFLAIKSRRTRTKPVQLPSQAIPTIVPIIPQQTSDYTPQAGQSPGQAMNPPPLHPLTENTSQSPTVPSTLGDFHTDKSAPTEYMDYTKPPKREEDYSNLNAGHPDCPT
jgi:hypothetical protein